MISRRHTRLIIALLLPLMVLRAMLPAGYMPVAESGVLRMAMCSDGLYPIAAEQGEDRESGDSDQLPSDSASCPFANAAVNAAPPAISKFIVRIDSGLGVSADFAAPVLPASIVRTQSARGPPAIYL